MLHEDRRRASSFGSDAERYDRARPSYPAALVDALVGDATPRVLDVGCGTGISSRLFVARGCDVLGVEPDERMAHVARESGLDVETADFEHWDPAGRTFDLLASGSAWHWINPRTGAERAAAVIEPGGTIGLFWNVARHRPEVRAKLDEAYVRCGLDTGNHAVVLGAPRLERFDIAAAGLESVEEFGPVERRSFEWEQVFSKEEWLDHLPTHSDHQVLAPSVLAALLVEVGTVIDELGGAITVGYESVLLRASRSAEQRRVRVRVRGDRG